MATSTAPAVQQTPAPVTTSGAGQGPRPFRIATLVRDQLVTQQGPFAFVGAGYNSQSYPGGLNGDGYLAKLTLDVNSQGGVNNTTPALYHEDAPFSAIAMLGLADPNAQILGPMSGYNAWLASLANGMVSLRANDGIPKTSIQGEVLQDVGAGQGAPVSHIAGDPNGNFRFLLDIPVYISKRSAMGILGNQSKAVIYSLQNDIAAGTAAPAGPIYTQIPAGGTLPQILVNGTYTSFTVPPSVDPASRMPNQVAPPSFGTIHYVNAAQLAQAPAPGPVIHTITGTGRVVRWYMFVLRCVNSAVDNVPRRAFTELAPPTNILVTFGSTIVFNGSYSELRKDMARMLGFQMPAGVLFIPWCNDADQGADGDKGFDWKDTRTINQATIQITYPVSGISGVAVAGQSALVGASAFWAPGSTITRITDELVFAAPQKQN